jgi:hypothetical protein
MVIRQAAIDENYAQDLQQIASADQASFDGLVHAPIVQADLRWLSPSEWLWFGRWRQSMGGQLDAVLLDYLGITLRSRFARFELRGLVMRDPRTIESASRGARNSQEHSDTGLRWLQRHAQETPDSLAHGRATRGAVEGRLALLSMVAA